MSSGENKNVLYVSGFPRNLMKREVKNMFSQHQGFEDFIVIGRGPVPLVFVKFETVEQAFETMFTYFGQSYHDLP